MTVAKPRKKRKTVGTWLRDKLLPTSSDVPGRMDFPSIQKAKKAAAKRRRILEELGR